MYVCIQKNNMCLNLVFCLLLTGVWNLFYVSATFEYGPVQFYKSVAVPDVLLSTKAISLIHCATLCVSTPGCLSFDFECQALLHNKEEGLCNILSNIITTNTVNELVTSDQCFIQKNTGTGALPLALPPTTATSSLSTTATPSTTSATGSSTTAFPPTTTSTTANPPTTTSTTANPPTTTSTTANPPTTNPPTTTSTTANPPTTTSTTTNPPTTTSTTANPPTTTSTTANPPTTNPPTTTSTTTNPPTTTSTTSTATSSSSTPSAREIFGLINIEMGIGWTKHYLLTPAGLVIYSNYEDLYTPGNSATLKDFNLEFSGYLGGPDIMAVRCILNVYSKSQFEVYTDDDKLYIYDDALFYIYNFVNSSSILDIGEKTSWCSYRQFSDEARFFGLPSNRIYYKGSSETSDEQIGESMFDSNSEDVNIFKGLTDVLVVANYHGDYANTFVVIYANYSVYEYHVNDADSYDFAYKGILNLP